ncbi:MAG: GNAT family acetyltransferase [Agathobacter sp.]|nr:GNAT family acetyltransferase [Agathobacter sp.]
MLTYDEVLNLNYYKKTSYTGWIKPLRFLIKMEKPEKSEAIFHAWVWPGPYIFDLTDDSLKLDKTASFSEDGKREIVDWINEQYDLHKDEWSSKLL